ncbi:MAG: hypothetical protein HC809_14700 [Gammaproteobacteria bacterium]|nr:hypothetical protein [Gammaproteobacteria bacterium]
MSVDILWYLARLKLMSSAELVHRVTERVQLRRLQRSQQDFPAPAEIPIDSMSFCCASNHMLPALRWDLSRVKAQAAELLTGRWAALGFDWHWQDTPDVWHRRPTPTRSGRASTSLAFHIDTEILTATLESYGSQRDFNNWWHWRFSARMPGTAASPYR